MNPELVNRGCITVGHAAADGDACARTIVITGLGRSGTTMMAALLQEAALPIGEFLADGVLEDRELLDLIARRDLAALHEAVALRDAREDVWGFKLPNLHRYLRHTDLSVFRNPRMVVVLRDVVAVAVRHAIAEHWDPFDALSDIAEGTLALTHFVRLAGCPALAFPDETIGSILGFCGLLATDDTRRRMHARISPNDETYAMRARRVYEGFIEHLDDEGSLCGWCRDTNEVQPVRLILQADEVPIACFTAGLPRDDLLAARFGNGNHGFKQPLNLSQLRPDTVLRDCKPTGGSFALCDASGTGSVCRRWCRDVGPAILPNPMHPAWVAAIRHHKVGWLMPSSSSEGPGSS
jgi:hypothetical protein